MNYEAYTHVNIVTLIRNYEVHTHINILYTTQTRKHR